MLGEGRKETYSMEVLTSSVYYPEKRIKTGEYIRSRTGITERVVASPHETHFFMASKTLEDLLSKSNVNPKDISVIIARNTGIVGHIPCVAAEHHKVVSTEKAEPAIDILYDGQNNALLAGLRATFEADKGGYIEHDARGFWEQSSEPAIPFEERLCAVVHFDIGSLAYKLSKEYGLSEKYSFDVVTGCASLNAALQLACGFNKVEQKYFAVIGVDRMNDLVDVSDKSTNDLFGDLASGFLLKPSYNGFLAHKLNTEIDVEKSIWAETAGEKEIFKMKGLCVYKWAIPAVLSMINEAIEIKKKYEAWRFLELLKTKVEEPKGRFFVGCHQANPRMIEEIAQKAPSDVYGFALCGDATGNGSTASIGQSFHNLRTQTFNKKGNILRLNGDGEKVKLEPYDYVLVVGFGAGLTKGWNLLRVLP